MSISTFLGRASLAAVAVVIGGCRVSDVQDPATLPTLAAGRASYAAQPNRDKIGICHRTNGDREFMLISVAPPAVDAHVAHGDGRPGEAFPGQPGMRFGPNCQPEIIPFHETLPLSARGMVRDADHNGFGDAIVLNDTLLVSFNEPMVEEQRSFLEFGIAQLSQPVGHADLMLVPVKTGSGGNVPIPVDVFVYPGDGALTLSDFRAGSFITTFGYAGQSQITLDVTAALNSLITTHATYAGFDLAVRGGYRIAVATDPLRMTPSLEVRTP